MTTWRNICLTVCLLPLTACGGGTELDAIDQAEQPFTTTILRNDLQQPWGMAFLPDQRALITEKPGRLSIVDLATGEEITEVSGLPAVSEVGQGGLLDVAVDPEFAENQWVYLSYAAGENGLYGTEVGRGQLQLSRLENFTTLFTALPKKSGGNHFGSRLVFGPHGHLFITLGERGDREEAQNLQSHLGSVIRINRDGSIPNDNPFLGTADALAEIFSYGHRNIQGAAIHPDTGELWVHEHGPQGGDEINLVRAGLNYGWPVVTFGKEYITGISIGEGTTKPGYESPLWQWTPSIAPSGMAFYAHTRIPEWSNSLLVGALKFQLLSRLTATAEGKVMEIERLFESRFGRIRNVDVDENGYVYLLTDASDGKLVKIGPH